ncbi:hypothetical protein ACVGWG_00595, partial [Enterobacter asburiae]
PPFFNFWPTPDKYKKSNWATGLVVYMTQTLPPFYFFADLSVVLSVWVYGGERHPWGAGVWAALL